MISVPECRKLAKKTLSKARYIHTINVCKMAKTLAKRHNYDCKKAKLAALLHDLAKEMPKAQMLQLFSENAIMAGNIEKRPSVVWHGVAAAIIAKKRLLVEDEEILNAVACHTTARAQMTTLDKILFLSDMVCAERSYDGVKKLRKLAKANLDAAMIKALKMNIEWIDQKGKPVDEQSRLALQWFVTNFPEDNTNEQ